MKTDTFVTIVAVAGTSLALWPAIDSRFMAIRQDLAELRQEVRAHIAALNSCIDSLDARFTSRIDILYQVLFSHKDRAV